MLTIPDLSEVDQPLDAALCYADAGWYILPVQPGTKNPGSVVKGKWQDKSSRDDQQIIDWWLDNPDYGIALHCGRSGAVVLDVDRPENLPELLVHMFTQYVPPYQTTRRESHGRGHYIFAMPEGRKIGNSTSGLEGGWGEVRGYNGVIIVAPSRHPEPDGFYQWQRIGEVPVMPPELADRLNDSQGEVDAANDAEIATFLTTHKKGADLFKLDHLVQSYADKVRAGESRHETAVWAVTLALKEAKAGFYPAERAVLHLLAPFVASVRNEPGRNAHREFQNIVAYAIGAATADDTRARVQEARRRSEEIHNFGGLLGDRPLPAKNDTARGAELNTDREAGEVQTTTGSTSLFDQPHKPIKYDTGGQPSTDLETDMPETDQAEDGEEQTTEIEVDTHDQMVNSKYEAMVVRDEATKRFNAEKYPFAQLVSERGFASATELIAEVRGTKREYLIDRWLPRGSYGALGAEYKAGKTWLALDLAVSIMSGTPFLGSISVRPGKVAIMYNEGDLQEFFARLEAVAESKGVMLNDTLLRNLMVQAGSSVMSDPVAVNKFYTDLEPFKPDLILIDPWYMAAGEEANGKNIQEMGLVLRNIQGVAQEIGASLLITHHWNKSGEGKGINRWAGSGLQEWGRVLINVAVQRYEGAKAYHTDRTGRTVVDLSVELTGQVSGSYQLHREVWMDDAADLESRMHYSVSCSESGATASNVDGVLAFGDDVTKTPREGLLIAYGLHPKGMTRSKSVETALEVLKKGRRDYSKVKIAFDELVAEELIEPIGEAPKIDPNGVRRGVVTIYGLSEAGKEALLNLDTGPWLRGEQDQ